MKKPIILLISAGVALSLTGCANMTNQDVGVLAGAAAGGLLGSQFGRGSGKILATVAGTVAGGFLGGAVGRSMDRTDHLYMNRTLEKYPSGKSYAWHNPDNGNNYSVTPTRTYERRYRGSTQPCRDYTMKVSVAGHDRPQRVVGRACRMADGTWQDVKS